MKLLIIIPAYNEGLNIERVMDHLILKFPQYDYVIVNDGSKDNTADICRAKNYNFVDLPINLGLSCAVQTGMRYAVKNGYDAVLQMDGDGQHRPEYIEKMIQEMERSGAEIVIGSRFVEKEGFQSSQMRRIGINFLSNLAWILTGVRVKDITSGYRVINRNFIHIFAEDYPSDYPEPEAMVIAAVHGGKIREYPVVMRERENGESSITLKKSVYYMIKVTLAMLIRRLSFGVRRQK